MKRARALKPLARAAADGPRRLAKLPRVPVPPVVTMKPFDEETVVVPATMAIGGGSRARRVADWDLRQFLSEASPLSTEGLLPEDVLEAVGLPKIDSRHIAAADGAAVERQRERDG